MRNRAILVIALITVFFIISAIINSSYENATPTPVRTPSLSVGSVEDTPPVRPPATLGTPIGREIHPGAPCAASSEGRVGHSATGVNYQCRKTAYGHAWERE